jgi:GNAT superfamily N-acetyltransferase
VRLAWMMRIESWDPADEPTARACHEVTLAAHTADQPVEPPTSYPVFAMFFREGWDRLPGESWVARDDGGAVIGWYRVDLPDLENQDEAYGGPTVHPAFRRRGIGRELLRHAGTRAQAHGRTRFAARTDAGSAGDAFAQAVGARLDLEEALRIQYLREIAPGSVEELRASAQQAAAGYSLVSWEGETPEKYHGPLAGVLSAFNDAPHGENTQPEQWTADRVRERTGQYERAGLLRGHSVAALADETGEMVAFSGVLVEPSHPEWGFQQLTAVIRSHRGHRLGLLVKIAMLDLLAKREPQLDYILTGNAAANSHMIAVNEQLGYRLAQPGLRFYEMPVADMR